MSIGIEGASMAVLPAVVPFPVVLPRRSEPADGSNMADARGAVKPNVDRIVSTSVSPLSSTQKAAIATGFFVLRVI